MKPKPVPNAGPSASASSRTQSVRPRGPSLDAKEALRATRIPPARPMPARTIRTGAK